jgi:hypothetical protein
MTRPRDVLYVWVTWLSRLMGGDVRCQWAPWFKTHYTGYIQVPSDFQLAVWTVEHTQLLDELSKERSALGEGIYRENQNEFKGRRPSGLVIAGRPDLITVDQGDHCTVYDVKTGKPRQSDIIQVMLYMMFLPYASPLYEGKELSGCVVYKDGSKSDIPHKTINDAFQKNVTYFLDILESADAPARTPHPTECHFCDITNADCPDRKEPGGADLIHSDEPEISV